MTKVVHLPQECPVSETLFLGSPLFLKANPEPDGTPKKLNRLRTFIVHWSQIILCKPGSRRPPL
jgi:hypothetical protein